MKKFKLADEEFTWKEIVAFVVIFILICITVAVICTTWTGACV